MLYESRDPMLLRFAINPAAEVKGMRETSTTLSRWSRFLYRIPLFRGWISKQQVECLLLTKVLDGLESSIDTLPEYLFEEARPVDKNTVGIYLERLSDYLSIGYGCEEGSPVAEWSREELMDLASTQLFAKFEYTNNRVAESLKLRPEHNLAIVSHKELWLAYYLSEVYYLVANGVMEVSLSRRGLLIKPSEDFSLRIKAYWLAQVSEESTTLSDMKMMAMALERFRVAKVLPPVLENLMLKMLMDKCLSIHADYVPAAMAADPQYQLLREIVCFALYLELNAKAGQPHVSVAQMRSYVSPATLSVIDAGLRGKLPLLDSVGSFVTRDERGYQRGPVKLKYGIKKLIQQSIGKVFVSRLGDYFEKDYIVNYMRSLSDPRFELFDGFQGETKAAIKKFDIDFVLRDVESEIYYFVQVKYKAFYLPVYFGEQCRLMGDENFRKGFDVQLLELKRNLGDPTVRQKLLGLGLQGAGVDNSHFILLHNLPFLNFYEFQGVFFYEWNLFRNLLKNGKVHFVKGNEVTQASLLRKPCFHRPDEMVEAYFEQGPLATEMRKQFEMFKRTYVKFSYRGINVVCKTL